MLTKLRVPRGVGLAVLLASSAPACGGGPRTRPNPNLPPPSHAEYTVTGLVDGSAQVSGVFRYVAQELSLSILNEVTDLTIEGGYERAGDTRLRAPGCKKTCAFRYTLPAHSTRVVESSKLLLLPGNAPQEAKVRVRGTAASGLFGEGEDRRLLFQKTREGAPFAFGPLRTKELSPGLELVVLAPNEFPDATRFDAWAVDAYRGVSALYGKPPVPKARLFLQPLAGRDHPVFGRALTLSGPSVLLLLGTETPAAKLHEDWTLVHEFIHLGFPTLIGGDYWMEGLSTYFEPIVRARLGWYSANEAWGDLYRGMADVAETPPLADSKGINATYWGGAALMLLCDVELHRRTGRSLQTLLQQELLRGRTSADELTVETALRDLDGPDGGQGVLTELFQRHATSSTPLPMKALFEDLGIGPDGAKDGPAKLGTIRQSIMNGR